MTTTTKTHITITMSDRAPIKLARADWPHVATADWHTGEHASQANEVASISVREHDDGRRIVYGHRDRGPGGMAIGYRGKYAGFLIESEQDPTKSTGVGRPNEAGTIRAIRRVAGVIDMPELADECIADLPAEELA